MLDHGFTSAYSAGSLTPVPTEVWLRDRIAAGHTPGPRMRAASFERDNNPVQMGPDGPEPKNTGPDAVREFIREQAATGFDAVKLLMSNDDVFVEGGSMVTQYSPEEAQAAGEQARECGVWLNCHAQAPESIKPLAAHESTGVRQRRRAQTGGRCTLITAERPPRTMASASLSTWGSSPGSDTVTP
jgi:hypothetical protein